MILEKIANIIQKLVEGIGYAARWGGEEILILSENKYLCEVTNRRCWSFL